MDYRGGRHGGGAVAGRYFFQPNRTRSSDRWWRKHQCFPGQPQCGSGHQCHPGGCETQTGYRRREITRNTDPSPKAQTNPETGTEKTVCPSHHHFHQAAGSHPRGHFFTPDWHSGQRPGHGAGWIERALFVTPENAGGHFTGSASGLDGCAVEPDQDLQGHRAQCSQACPETRPQDRWRDDRRRHGPGAQARSQTGSGPSAGSGARTSSATGWWPSKGWHAGTGTTPGPAGSRRCRRPTGPAAALTD